MELDGIVVPGGFGARGVEGKIAAAGYAREHDVPFLGLCLGLQSAVIEFARDECGLTGANSSEFDPHSPHPVIDLMDDQREVVDKGGTMRLGAYPAKLVPGTKVHEAYGEEVVYERHRHRYEVNNKYRAKLEEMGMVCSGTSPDGRLVEFVELPSHPFYVATQAHPEFKSRPDRPHPLFSAFVRAGARSRRGPPTEAADRAGRRGAPVPRATAQRATDPRDGVTFEVVATTTVLDVGFLVVDRVQVRAPDGEHLERHVVRHPGAVAVVPLDADGQIVMVRQYRAALDSPLLEIPAGKRDVAGEAPTTTARRELEEEIGCVAGVLHPLGEFYNSPGFCDEHTHVFLATDLRVTERAAVSAEEAAMEIVRVRFTEIDDLMQRGELVDAKSIIGVLRARAFLQGASGPRGAPEA